MSIIKRILNMALRFSKNFLQFEQFQELSSTENLHTTSTFENMQQAQAALTPDSFMQEMKGIDTYLGQQITLLVSILQDIVAQKHLPHLMDLLLRLNYNLFYRPI